MTLKETDGNRELPVHLMLNGLLIWIIIIIVIKCKESWSPSES